jgi:two-component system, LytTR family, response regulator
MKNLTATPALAATDRETLARRFALPDLTLPFWGYRKKMPMHRIVRLEGEGNYTLFHFADGTRLMVSLTLKKMQTRLSPMMFARPHKKNIINLLYLEDIHAETNQMSVSLANGDRVDVSRRKATGFFEQVSGFQRAVEAMG